MATASSPVAQQVVVNYSMSGTARNGMDYTLSGASSQIMIPAGQTSGTATLTVTTTKTKGSEKAKMTLQAGTGYNMTAAARHRTPKSAQATVTIHNR